MTGVRKLEVVRIERMYCMYCLHHDMGYLVAVTLPENKCCDDIDLECVVWVTLRGNQVEEARHFLPEEVYDRRGGGWSRLAFFSEAYNREGRRLDWHADSDDVFCV